MKFLRTLHTLTEIGAMVVQSVAAAVSVRDKSESTHEDRISQLEAELEAIKQAAQSKRRK